MRRLVGALVVVLPGLLAATPTSASPAAGTPLARSYFGARYYASQTGRFTSVDPVYTWQENLVDPQRWNRYAYVRNNPLRYTDPDGRVLDTILDVASIGYDLFDIGRSLVGGEGVTWTQGAALGADVLSAVVPFGTGGGAAVRAAARVRRAESLSDARKSIEGVEAVAVGVDSGRAAPALGEAATNRAQNLAKGIPESQLGPSGRPKIHVVDHGGRRKAAKDAARADVGSGGTVTNHTSPSEGKDHYHGVSRSGEKSRVHHEYDR